MNYLLIIPSGKLDAYLDHTNSGAEETLGTPIKLTNNTHAPPTHYAFHVPTNDVRESRLREHLPGTGRMLQMDGRSLTEVVEDEGFEVYTEEEA